MTTPNVDSLLRRLTRPAFEAYLVAEAAKGEPASRRGKRSVGIPGSQCYCPLAYFLMLDARLDPDEPARVTYHYLIYGGRRRRLPAWARNFTRAVDACEWIVRAQEALEMLRQETG